MYRFSSVAIGLAMLAIALGGCRTTARLTSLTSESPISVDGQLDEWEGGMTGFLDEKILVGVRDDGQRAYVAIQVQDQAVMRQIMMTGLQIWLDPDGGRDELFGIQYPLGFLAYNRGRTGQIPLPTGRSDPREMARMFEETLSEIDVHVAGSSPRRMIRGESPEMLVSTRLAFGTLTYELSFPLSGSDALGLPAIDDQGGYGLSVQTGVMGRPNAQQRERPQGGRGVGGRGGGMNGRGGGMSAGRRPAGARGGAPEPIELWIQVTNADGEAPSQDGAR